jgi:hypothetical protein
VPYYNSGIGPDRCIVRIAAVWLTDRCVVGSPPTWLPDRCIVRIAADTGCLIAAFGGSLPTFMLLNPETGEITEQPQGF